MNINKYLFTLSFILTLSLNVKGQYYDGWLDMVAKLGYEPGNTSYAIFGAEAGLNRYVSIGMSFKYLTSSQIIMPSNTLLPSVDMKFGYSLRADLHGFYLLGLNKSDILIGYNRVHGASGVHSEYRYFFNEFLAVYGRGKYHLTKPRLTPLSSKSLNSNIRIELGVIFKVISGNSYSVDW